MSDQHYGHFDTLEYLATGSPRQQESYALLHGHQVFDKLTRYAPLLVGTIPIGIDVESSDLDIICCIKDEELFSADVKEAFSECQAFSLETAVINDVSSVIANFMIDGQLIEVFGQAVPVKEQNGYRHMIAEYELLRKHGEPLRQQVIQLKRQGLKTEPAFAQALGLAGDPYQALLYLYPL